MTCSDYGAATRMAFTDWVFHVTSARVRFWVALIVAAAVVVGCAP